VARFVDQKPSARKFMEISSFPDASATSWIPAHIWLWTMDQAAPAQIAYVVSTPKVPYNPHIKYFEGNRRSSLMATVTSTQMWLDVRFMTSMEQQDTTGYTEKSFVVLDGDPGAPLA
jgi:phosphodiesterase/alkaline phosphatase D-like protein